jgi:hypothetical protein
MVRLLAMAKLVATTKLVGTVKLVETATVTPAAPPERSQASANRSTRIAGILSRLKSARAQLSLAFAPERLDLAFVPARWNPRTRASPSAEELPRNGIFASLFPLLRLWLFSLLLRRCCVAAS